jgi:hypothetical protein
MAYTQAQWDRIQSSLDPDARVSYLEYLQSADPVQYAKLTKSNPLQSFRAAESATASRTDSAVSAVESAAAARAKKTAERKAIEDKAAKADAELRAAIAASNANKTADAYYTKIVADGLTQAQLDAIANATQTANLLNQTYGGATPVSKIDPKTGKIVTDTAAVGANALKGEAALAAERAAAKAAADKAAQEAAAKAAADKAAADKAAADKAAADAAAKAAAEAEAKRIALEKAAAEAKAAQEAAEKLLREAKNAAEVQAAKAAEAIANAKAAAAAKALEEQQKKAEADAKAAAEAADAKLKQALLDAKTASDKAAAEAAIKAAQEAKAAADVAAAKAARDAAEAAAATAVASAAANINVTGNTMIPLPGETPADTYARVTAEKLKMEERESTIKILTDRFNKYNLNGLASTIKKLAIEGANEATITLALQETPEYKDRFKANELRAKKGLKVLDPGTYLRDEDAYRQVLRSYGLKQFDTDDYVSQFIANDVSPTEFSNRVVTAVQRVQNADPAIVKQLNEFYGIKPEGLVAYVLDPEQQLQKIERQVAAAEIGVAAARQGFATGKDFAATAEQLAAQGISQAEAQKGYATIADILPTAEKLSSIYGGTMDTYGQSEAEQEVFNSLASAQRKRQRLTAREVAAFSGSAGAAKTSLTSPRVGQY